MDDAATTTSTDAPRKGLFVPLPTSAIAAALLAIVLIGAAILIWQLWPRDPGSNSSEAGFLRDMSTHHAQAVDMAMIIRDRTEDPELLALATDIALTQSQQIGTMQGYLNAWDLPTAGTEQSMTWMGHAGEAMPGLASSEQVQQLRDLPVAEAEVLFLQLMIRHHQGGVDMAESILDRSDQPQIELMADRIVLMQDSEIDTMNQMLEVRAQEPVTDPLPGTEDHEGH